MMLKRWPLAVLAVMFAASAYGHARLRATVPAADAQLQSAPKSLTLTFNESVRLAVLTVTAGGKTIPLSIDRNAPATAEVTIALPALAIGTYEVQWSVLSADDGHVSKGTFSFAIVATPSAAATSH
jgi:methionine-rich copper-binding protein CopC